MSPGGSFQRLLRSPAARAAASLGVYLLAAQTAGLGLLLEEPAAACCCAHDGERACKCRSCTHARTRDTGQPQVETCRRTAPAAVVAFPDAFEPPAAPAADVPRPLQAPRERASLAPPEPEAEVPTPPPRSGRSAAHR